MEREEEEEEEEDASGGIPPSLETKWQDLFSSQGRGSGSTFTLNQLRPLTIS